MKLVMLGTNGFLPTDKAQTACYLLPEQGILLDAGSGLYRIADHLQTDSLEVYLSHAHGDHTRGLTYLFASYFKKMVSASSVPLDEKNVHAFERSAAQALNRTRIHAAPLTLAEVKTQYETFGYAWCGLQTQETLPGGGILTHFPLEHGASECVGYRLDWPGHSLAYVTDTVTRPDSSYIRKIRGVDLLLHECNCPDRLARLTEQIGHTHTSAVAQAAASAGVNRVYLIHKSPFEEMDIHPDLASARKIFPHLQVAEDGLQVEF